ncbi:MAG: D-alanine--D-alanine ligase [Betaproteobacteria bacterium]|jgi:D-alanine-D-alanine ligase|nr:D-alanine--D-alanine ligase [Pseudomonadota bacterium]NBO04124.1 D-alanine--D-alanine ligase [Betaproteobacteria bacterium]NBO96261.1 D-alanine--D-alanine ligase [Betaproteobacteria bacterium]NBP34738.1 D-alanine--D-alanine ligase [Betaproteobacteria bacterium]NBP37672.1 D-alanine--D-alanine ligase [Betaproteobacteria bacterium]
MTAKPIALTPVSAGEAASLADALGKVAVLMGGSSAEREISLRSGQGVLKALTSFGLDAAAFDPAEQALDRLQSLGVSRVFIALHGRYGEDGTVQGALELLGIPYTGSGVQASAIAIDKIRTKQIWGFLGLPTPASVQVREDGNAKTLIDTLGLPMVIKPAREGSTLGLTKVFEASALEAALTLARASDPLVLAERLIAGRELTVAVVGEDEQAQALPIVEIRAPQGNYDYQHKYFSDDTEYLCPAPLDPAVSAQVQALALAAFRALGCSGWGRVDFMLDASNRPWLLEVNTSPGMTDHSLVPMAARALGLSYESLVLRLLEQASLKLRRAG